MTVRRAGTTTIRDVRTAADLVLARALFLEYASSLGVDLGFQDFEREVSALPGDYEPPDGCLLLASDGAEILGCVGVRRFKAGICEMKRLYVRPAARGRGAGRTLVEAAIRFARSAGYREMRLDTLPSMSSAQALYRELGFVDIPPYRYNPVSGCTFLTFDLTLESERGRPAQD